MTQGTPTPSSRTIVQAFDNRNEEPLTLVVEPWGDAHEVPHLATAGIRYVPKAAHADRSTCVISENRIELWCDADSYEVDIVYPAAFDRLLWEICVHGGWCGGLVDGVPTTVDDLLPESGTITAREFAILVCRADGYSPSEQLPEKHVAWLEARFARCLGASAMDIRHLRRNLRRPFDRA